MLKSHITGKIGEAQAYFYLTQKKYKIIETNFFSPYGEIDIIAKKGKEIVFVEVKTRTTCAFKVGMEAVDAHKQECIKKTAAYYFSEKNKKVKSHRFDVISVVNEDIEHLENAFY